MKKHVLLDLDGTLTDPREGVCRSIQYALGKGSHPVPSLEELFWCIGPPLHHSFAELVPGRGEEYVRQLVAWYRERYGELGQFENLVYPGIPELLTRLGGAYQLHLATSKPHVYARRILSHYGLAQHFRSQHGSELDGTRSEKPELLAYILAQEGISPDEAYMVGDRKFDALGARAVGVTSIGITWGHGSREELKNAGVDFIFDSPADLGDFLLRKAP